MTFAPHCLPSAVGSLPHRNPQDAVELVLRYLPEIPTWPQLPNSSFLESMYVQYSSGMPFVRLDAARERMHMDLSGDIYVALERFYERMLADELDAFAIPPEYASGMHAFIHRLWRHPPENLQFIKGQITGPISYGLMVTDERKRSVLYHEEVFDVILKTLALKARWQIRFMKRLWKDVIIFIDEPYLSSFGSAFINLNRDQVLAYLGETIAAIHQEGALAGVHCCGNTDWSILMDTEVDIINFDAHEYFQGLTLYMEQLQSFLGRGGVLAWGVVPTQPKAAEMDAAALQRHFQEEVGELVNRGIKKDLLLRQCLLTPSCGMGSLQENSAEIVLRLVREVSDAVRSKLLGKKLKKAIAS